MEFPDYAMQQTEDMLKSESPDTSSVGAITENKEKEVASSPLAPSTSDSDSFGTPELSAVPPTSQNPDTVASVTETEEEVAMCPDSPTEEVEEQSLHSTEGDEAEAMEAVSGEEEILDTSARDEEQSLDVTPEEEEQVETREEDQMLDVSKEYQMLNTPEEEKMVDTSGEQEPTVDTTEQEEPGLDVTEQEESGLNVTEEEEPGLDVTEEEEPGLDATEEEEPGLDVTEEEEPGLNVTEEEEPGLNVPEEEEPGFDVTEEEEPGLNVPEEEEPAFDVTEEEEPAVESTGDEKPTFDTTGNEEPTFVAEEQEAQTAKMTEQDQMLVSKTKEKEQYQKPGSTPKHSGDEGIVTSPVLADSTSADPTNSDVAQKSKITMRGSRSKRKSLEPKVAKGLSNSKDKRKLSVPTVTVTAPSDQSDNSEPGTPSAASAVTPSFSELPKRIETFDHLPPGWRRLQVMRTGGKQAGRYDTTLFSDENHKMRSFPNVKAYLEKMNLLHYLNDKQYDFQFKQPFLNENKNKCQVL